MPPTTNHKAWTAGVGSAAGVLVLAVIARLTGVVEMPDTSDIEAALAAIAAAATAGFINGALTWLVPNRPKPPVQSGDGTRGVGSMMGLALVLGLLGGCTTVAQLSDCERAQLGLDALLIVLDGEAGPEWLARLDKAQLLVDRVCAPELEAAADG